MDKITLSKEELQKLVRFIGSRGFKDPLIAMDILDHFSCKVEEELAAHSGLSLEMAMQQAHYSFGIKGFQPLAAAGKGALLKRCTAIYKMERLGIFTSVPGMSLLIGGSVLFYCGYYLAAVNNLTVAFMDCNLATFCVYLAILISAIVFNIKFKAYKGLYEIANQATLGTDKLLWVLLIAEFLLPEVITIRSFVVLAGFRTLLFAYVFVRQWSVYHAIKKVVSSFLVDISTMQALIPA